MFTGLIQKIGRIASWKRAGGGARLCVQCSAWEAGDPLAPGESVAVQGCCLTVAEAVADGGGFEADVLDETLRASALGSLPVGASVNLERALRAGDRLGGHIVQGHVDGTVRVVGVFPDGCDLRMRFSCSDDVARYVVYKGSVALDGTSLTVSAVPEPGLFEVCLIPTTLECTTLSLRREGDSVNVETDIVGRYVESFARAAAGCAARGIGGAGGGVTEQLLQKAGFLQ